LRRALVGYVTDVWQSSLGYAYTDAKIAKDLTLATVALPILAGNRVQLVPYNQFAWWNKYQINDTWGCRASASIYFSDSYANLRRHRQACRALSGFDTAVYVKIDEHWRGAAQCRESLNKGYWASADGDNNISPGQSRTVRVMARSIVLGRLFALGRSCARREAIACLPPCV